MGATLRFTVKRALITVVATALLGSLAFPLSAQDLHPSRRPSPMGMARVTVDGTYIRVVYGRPYERGRDNIFGTAESGALVPFGEVWRTGANEATEITLTGDLLVAGEHLPAGTYSLFTTPGPSEWQIHFNRELGLDGTGRFDPETESFEAIDLEATNALTVTVEPSRVEEKVEQLTIDLEPIDGGADMVLRWIHTEVRVPMRVTEGTSS